MGSDSKDVSVSSAIGNDLSKYEKAMQGKVTGLIIPPPDIKSIVDKTAQFVARNGKSFEERILNSEEGQSAKFNFMQPHDPFNAYYEYKIRFYEEGGEDVKPEEKATGENGEMHQNGEAQPMQNGIDPSHAPRDTTVIEMKASITTPLLKAIQRRKEEPPTPLMYLLNHPEGLSACDIDVIKLTAQFTAIGGRSFLAGLASREQKNPQFDFLKPTHVLFSYFTSLVDSYAKISHTNMEDVKTLQENDNDQEILERIVHRWEFTREMEERKKTTEAEADSERVAFQSVNWHDFVVVETIEFHENELQDLPYGTTEEQEEDEDMEMDEGSEDEDMDEDEDVPAPPPLPPSEDTIDPELKVVTDYTPQIGSSKKAGGALIDPITGKLLSSEEVSEHMRIQLLDPKWREENRRMLRKQEEASLADGQAIADNLEKIAKKRGDIFGTTEEEEKQILLEEAERKKRRQGESGHIIWDGHSSSATAAKEMASSAPPPVLPPVATKPVIGPLVPGGESAAPPPPAPPRAAGLAPPSQVAPPPPPPPPPQTAPGAPPMPPPMGMPGMPGAPPMGMPGMMPPHIQNPGLMPVMPYGMGDMSSMIRPEHEFAAAFPAPVTLQIRVPVDDKIPQWGLHGQVLTLSLNVMSTLRSVKDEVSPRLGGMPVNKMQLRKPGQGFLKDNLTLAYYNIGEGFILDLVPRSRGGRR